MFMFFGLLSTVLLCSSLHVLHVFSVLWQFLRAFLSVCAWWAGIYYSLVRLTRYGRYLWKLKRPKRFRRRALPYHLVLRCRRRRGNRPPPKWRWRRKKKRSWSHKTRDSPCGTQWDSGGVSSDTYKSFFDLHDPLSLSRSFSLQVVSHGRYTGLVNEESILQTLYRLSEIRQTYLRLAEMQLSTPKDADGFWQVPMIWDTGASIGLTPFRSDFIHYEKLEGVTVRDIARENKVFGIGTAMWKFITRLGHEVFLPVICYHVEHAEIRLMSPQLYFKRAGGYATVNSHNVTFHLPDDNIIDIPICPVMNLPLVDKVGTCERQKREYGPHLLSMSSPLNDFATEPTVLEPTTTSGRDSMFQAINRTQAATHNICLPCVADETNQQLTGPQKELLTWHWKLSINMSHIQELMRDRTFKLPDGTEKILPPIIPTKHVTTKSCPIPLCMSCELAKMRAKSPGVKISKAIEAKAGILSRDSYEPGDMVSSDQFNVHTPGRRLKGYGRESKDSSYHGGTVYIDAASGLVHVHMQVSLGAEETLVGKHKFEQIVMDLASVTVKRYHSDNGVFDTTVFREDCVAKEQKQTFSGVGAKHQNAVAERCIQTMSYWARTMMVHAAIHWPADGADNLRLWPFAMQHAAWLYNRLPNRRTGLTPLEIFTKTKADHGDLLRAHVWGCPVFVLDPTLQDGKKIPKWNKRSRLGQFLGFSDEHSSLVGRIRNLATNYVSPQYHVVYDDLFQTIFNGSTIAESGADAIFEQLFANAREHYAPVERDLNGNVEYEPPPLDDMWLSEAERREKRVQLERRRVREKELWLQREREIAELVRARETPSPSHPHSDLPQVSDDESDDSDDESLAPTPPEAVADVPTEDTNGRPRRERRQTKRLVEDPTWNTSSSVDPNRFPVLSGTRQTPVLASLARAPRSDKRYRAQYVRRTREYEEQTLNLLDWGQDATLRSFLQSEIAPYIQLAYNEVEFGSIDDTKLLRDFYVNYADPFVLAAKTTASSADNPTWNEAMNGPFAEEYWKAAEVEIRTLEDIEAWTVVERDEAENILPGTWAFKCKRYPDGSVKKFKARFCARGDRQKEGIDFFETYAPVAQWVTIRAMLILECMLGLVSKQGDITCAFLHAQLEPHERIYVEMPRGFKQYDSRGRPKILKLRRFLYGLRQSPRAFWVYMTEKLEAAGLVQSQIDPCLFVGPKVIVVMYVDDILFWSTDEKHIYDLGMQLREAQVDLEEESDAAGFLGVDLVRLPDGKIHLKQPGLIQRVISALGFNINETSAKSTPAERKPLTKDEDGEPPQETFSYASVVGMLLYLSGHSRPDLQYSVSQVARFMFSPKRSHELALKRIGRYLVGTADKGTILNPKDAKCLNIDAYPDADFAGMYGYEKSNDPVCVRSRTGYIIALANCPVLTYSSLQVETALSTMQAEIYALAQCCKALFPIIKLARELSAAVGLPEGGPPTMKITLHEDNSGALILANTIPPEFTPRSKFYALKTIWFREQIALLKIDVVKIETKYQWGDICTKMPPVVTFEFLRELIMGW